MNYLFFSEGAQPSVIATSLLLFKSLSVYHSTIVEF